MQKDQLVNIAKKMIKNGFIEESIKKEISHYIEYKFNESINFAKITEVHFDIFREDKNNSYKLKAMTIIELIILASDIMDDIQDKDTHKDVPWSNMDETYSFNIIIGILLICLNEVKTLGNKSEIEWLQNNIYQFLLQSINGQQLDLKNELFTESDYLNMCYLKSGSLIALACILGAVNVDKQLREKISEYSKYLGVVFQLRNDVADMKNGFIKNDLLLKKRTLPILYFLNTDDKAYAAIKDYYLNSSSNQDPTIIHHELMNKDALLYCSIVENIFINKYERIINQLNLSREQKNLLLGIISNRNE
ncbi:polyprenyl synthetase family protein [Oceanobacillus sp. J11TS1]|uniref:polyprenyl synthetase family protein n=1 Tax=Oceanobacillus sp. J11TS1 TaxID=2807191 RepID=UPI001B022DD9|nr:polyprenyl synthetase family protein [Oceanobacillus sp. J11TS1]GIO23008.1 competence regulatory protein ComQ [Oceanobacillus sp. J11TS1]